MSSCELIVFKNGLPDSSVEFKNSWGGATRIWSALFDAYVPKKDKYDSYLSSDPHDRRLWDIATRKDVQLFERAVHAFTFDSFYVSKEHFEQLAIDLLLFVEKYPCPGRVDHLPAWAKWLQENKDADAVALYGTSVGDNLWYRPKRCEHCDNYLDEEEPVPMSEGTEVYEWMKMICEKQ
ncbi:MAG: hypothetical protein M0R32_08400 [Candidatus Cloacimonetes bacterium]|jgi:hypothetical protein|nr:hypothetical protein [Candidatus Cloacimonadota bacterium]